MAGGYEELRLIGLTLLPLHRRTGTKLEDWLETLGSKSSRTFLRDLRSRVTACLEGNNTTSYTIASPADPSTPLHPRQARQPHPTDPARQAPWSPPPASHEQPKRGPARQPPSPIHHRTASLPTAYEPHPRPRSRQASSDGGEQGSKENGTASLGVTHPIATHFLLARRQSTRPPVPPRHH